MYSTDGFDPGARFELRAELGAGGMGVVYEAFDREREELVALKTLRETSGAVLARFKQEFRAMHDLVHPNLVALHELFDGATDPFFSMELVRGPSLLAYIRGDDESSAARRAALPITAGRTSAITVENAAAVRADAVGGPVTVVGFDERRMRAAFRQLAEGLGALHDAGIVHRDVKPSNVIVTAEGRVVLLDFGLVAELQGPRRSTDGQVVGTVEYMAPEQALSGEVSPAADWYSVGVVLYEALTGGLPHGGRSPYELILNKHQLAPLAPKTLQPGTPDDLDALCVALLAHAPEARAGITEVRACLGTARASTASRAIATSATGVPFVGRAVELAVLRRAFDDFERWPRIVVVEGSSGVGKTQLVEHFLSLVTDQHANAVVLTGRCFEREYVPFKALDGIADSLANHLAHRSAAEVAGVMPARPALLGRLFPVLKRLEVVAAAPPVPDLGDPQDQRGRMFAALRELFLRMSVRHRLVWFIDDLQWTDGDSLILLAELLAHEDRLPVLVIATCRTGDRGDESGSAAAWLRRIEAFAPVEAIALEPLSRDDARELAVKLLAGSDDATAERIAADAGGHPMLLHELARHVRTAQGTLPQGSSLTEMVRRRVDELDPSAQRLLEVVAISGGPIAQGVAAMAAAMSSAEQLRATSLLRAAHLIRTDGVRRTDDVVCYHDRVRDVVDLRLDDERRRAVHERIAIALEQTGAAERNPRALVRHARAAGRHALAATYAEVAARHAVSALAFDLAAELFAVALELGDRTGEQRRALQIELATALAHAGRGPEAASTFVAAARGAEPAVRFDCQRQAAEQWIITGHLEEGMAALRTTLDEIHEPSASSPRRALARVLWNRIRLRLRGMRYTTRLESQVPVETLRRLDVLKAVAHGLAMIDNIRGADFNTRYLRLALDTGESRRLVGALATEIVFLASQAGSSGRQARALYDDLVTLAATCPDQPFAQTWVLLADGAASFFEGRFAPAAAALERAEEIFVQGHRGLQYEKNNTRVFRVHALRMLGAVGRHGALVAELVRTGRQRGDRYLETSLRRLQVQALLARDDVAEARRAITETTWTPPEHGYHLQHWYSLRARVELSLYLGDAAETFESLASEFAALRRSLLLRVKLVRADAHFLRGRMLLAAGRRRAEVERVIAELEAERVGYATVFAALLRAGLFAADAHRDDDALVRTLRAAVDVAARYDMGLQLAAARHALGKRLRGTEGAALCELALDYARTNGVKEPPRFFAIGAPSVLG